MSSEPYSNEFYSPLPLGATFASPTNKVPIAGMGETELSPLLPLSGLVSSITPIPPFSVVQVGHQGEEQQRQIRERDGV